MKKKLLLIPIICAALSINICSFSATTSEAGIISEEKITEDTNEYTEEYKVGEYINGYEIKEDENGFYIERDTPMSIHNQLLGVIKRESNTDAAVGYLIKLSEDYEIPEDYDYHNVFTDYEWSEDSISMLREHGIIIKDYKKTDKTKYNGNFDIEKYDNSKNLWNWNYALLRESPSIYAPLIHELKHYNICTITGEVNTENEGKWYQIELTDGRICYAASYGFKDEDPTNQTFTHYDKETGYAVEDTYTDLNPEIIDAYKRYYRNGENLGKQKLYSSGMERVYLVSPAEFDKLNMIAKTNANLDYEEVEVDSNNEFNGKYIVLIIVIICIAASTIVFIVNSKK